MGVVFALCEQLLLHHCGGGETLLPVHSEQLLLHPELAQKTKIALPELSQETRNVLPELAKVTKKVLVEPTLETKIAS